ncbi:MAG TPA: hypothetical protein VMF35_03210 [Acidimicrobiales bacterium]|nr:hypothetical protein [Acidimicrobiales bacterium]
MKFSPRQILASAAGAVIAAVVLSVFGDKGTIVGVAIGSMAATLGTAFVSQSIDRGHKAVQQVAEQLPETSAGTLLRRLGGTSTSGAAASSADTGSTPARVSGSGAAGAGAGAAAAGAGSAAAATGTSPATAATDDTVRLDPGHQGSREETQPLDVAASPEAPATERLSASTMPTRRVATSAQGAAAGGGAASAGGGTAASGGSGVRASTPGAPAPRRYSWKALAAAAAIVFVLALLFITAVELISGKPLSDIFGGTNSGTTFFGNNPNEPSPTTTTTSTTTPSHETSTTTTSTSTPTSTTAPTGQATTTSTAPPTTTTAPSVSGSAGTGSAGTTTTSP